MDRFEKFDDSPLPFGRSQQRAGLRRDRAEQFAGEFGLLRSGFNQDAIQMAAQGAEANFSQRLGGLLLVERDPAQSDAQFGGQRFAASRGKLRMF